MKYLLLALIALTLTGCGGSSGGSDAPPSPYPIVQYISLDTTDVQTGDPVLQIVRTGPDSFRVEYSDRTMSFTVARPGRVITVDSAGIDNTVTRGTKDGKENLRLRRFSKERTYYISDTPFMPTSSG